MCRCPHLTQFSDIQVLKMTRVSGRVLSYCHSFCSDLYTIVLIVLMKTGPAPIVELSKALLLTAHCFSPLRACPDGREV